MPMAMCRQKSACVTSLVCATACSQQRSYFWKLGHLAAFCLFVTVSAQVCEYLLDHVHCNFPVFTDTGVFCIFTCHFYYLQALIEQNVSQGGIPSELCFPLSQLHSMRRGSCSKTHEQNDEMRKSLGQICLSINTIFSNCLLAKKSIYGI